MRKRHPSSTRSVFGITALCGILTVQIAWAANWTIVTPTDGSSRTKTANVSGGGMTSAADGTKASFEFGIPDLMVGFNIENSIDVTANLWAWGGTINPPAGGWSVSENHIARINWAGPPDGVDATINHIVTE